MSVRNNYNNKKSYLSVDGSGSLNVNMSSATGSHGLSTEAKQDTMISLLEGQTPSLNRPKAIPVQIMVGDAGGSYDALRANGQDLLVMIDDMNPDVAVNSGLATKVEQQTANTSLTNIDNTTANIDGKLSKNTAITADGTTSALGVNLLAQTDGTNFRSVKCDGNGALIVDNSEDSVISSDGTTQEQRVMVCGSNDGVNLRTLACNDNGDVRSLLVGTDNGGTTHEVQTSNNGILIVELDHSWETETLLTTTTLTAGSATTTNTLDMGQGVSHELDDVTFFVDNSNTSVSISIQPQSSPDGINWYVSSAGTSVSTTQAKSFICSDNCLNFGRANRYMRLRIVNNDASVSTDVSVQSGRYK